MAGCKSPTRQYVVLQLMGRGPTLKGWGFLVAAFHIL